jgi:hypothetical protein
MRLRGPGTLVSLLWWCASVLAPVTWAAERRISVGAALGGSTQPAGKSDRPYLGPGFGGTRLGFLAAAEARLSSSLGLAGEISLGGRISGSQQQRAPGGNNALLSQHRDRVLSLVLKLDAPAPERFHLALAGGAGLARRQTRRSGLFTPNSPPFSATPVAEELSSWDIALTGGIDGSVALDDRVSLVTMVRVHRILDDDRLPEGVVRRGVSSVIVRYGLGARVAF